jgi:SUN domain-containing protein 1/2
VEDEADHSGEYASFSSLGNRNGHGNGNGNGNGNGANTSGEQSYDYAAEESLVRRAQMAQKGSGGGVGGHARRVSDTTARRRKGREGDLPYRPGEEDEVYSDDSGGEGEGIVRGGALDARADTRGKRAEKGEGYLGMGLGLQPRARRKGRRSGDVSYAEGESEEEHENENGMGNLDLRGHSPFAASMVNGNARSPTPASLIRAITPQVNRRSPMPMPQTPSRRRQPPTSRTVVTNLLHGVVTALRFVVDLVSSLLNALVVHPIRTAFGSGKSIVRTARRDWWKYILGLVVLSLLIRLADRPWRSTGKYTAPEVPPSSMDELISRLTQIEQALSSLSASSNALERADAEGRGERETITSRVGELESSIAQERRHREVTRTEGQKGFQDIRGEVEGLRSEVRSLVSRVTEQEKGVSSARSAAQTLVAVGKEVEALKARVGAVEQDVRDALDDGRMRRALERILPSEMPVRVNKGGSIDVDPAFWTEMKRVLIGRGEVESMVRNVIGSAGGAQGGNGGDREASQGIREEELEAWGERLVAKKTKDGAIISRSDFLRLLDAEVTNLRQVMEDMSRKAPAPAPPSSGKSSTPSTVTIKSSKGDDLTSLLQGLIDAALLRYSKDTIARPDYALFSAGGRVVPSITTDTLVMRRSGAFGRYVLGKKDVEGLPPARALHPDNSVGSCWPFKGNQGQLGVLLSRRAVVCDVTIEHAPSEVAHDVSTAPRNVEVVSDTAQTALPGKIMPRKSSRGADARSLPVSILTRRSGDWSKAPRTRPTSRSISQRTLLQSESTAVIPHSVHLEQVTRVNADSRALAGRLSLLRRTTSSLPMSRTTHRSLIMSRRSRSIRRSSTSGWTSGSSFSECRVTGARISLVCTG